MLLEQEQLLFRHQEYLPNSLDLFKTKPKIPSTFHLNMNLSFLIQLTFSIYVLFCPKYKLGKRLKKTHINQNVPLPWQSLHKFEEGRLRSKNIDLSICRRGKIKFWGHKVLHDGIRVKEPLPTALPMCWEVLWWLFAISHLETSQS